MEKIGQDDFDFEQLTHYKDHFNWILLHSLFISGFAHFENFLRSIAESIEKQEENKIKLNDIKGNGDVDTYRKYIHLIGKISFANNGSHKWRRIIEYKDIRNDIIHRSGRIKRPNELMNKFCLFFGPSKKLIRIKNIQFFEAFAEDSTQYMESIVAGIKTRKCE